MKYTTLFLDLDNTLLDFNVAEVAALSQEFQEFGLGEFTEELLKEYMVNIKIMK